MVDAPSGSAGSQFGRALKFFLRHLFVGTPFRALTWSETAGERAEKVIPVVLPVAIRLGLGLGGVLTTSMSGDGRWTPRREWVVWVLAATWLVFFLQSVWHGIRAIEIERDALRAKERIRAILVESASPCKLFANSDRSEQAPNGDWIVTNTSYTIRAEVTITNPASDQSIALKLSPILPDALLENGPQADLRSTARRAGTRTSEMDKSGVIRMGPSSHEVWILDWYLPRRKVESPGYTQGASDLRLKVQVFDLLRKHVPPAIIETPGSATLS